MGGSMKGPFARNTEGANMAAQDADAIPSGTSGLQDLHKEAGLHSPATGQGFWPERWWRWIDYRIGIIPVPIYVVLVGLVATLV